ncbi:MAG: zinc ABC transporter substrate-binding protein [Chlamydiales bacterium]
MSYLHYFIVFLLVAVHSSFSAVSPESHSADSRSWQALVSIAPHKYFVEKIAGDTVKVKVLLPPGANAHSYDPTPKQVISASQADLWFRIGESFENKTLAALQSHNNRLKDIPLWKGIDLLQDSHQCGYVGCSSADPHYWLSPQLAKIQAKNIYEALLKYYPENAQEYTKNYQLLIEELDQLDREIAVLLNPLADRTMMVSHPAYAYFAKDYDLIQLSVEFEGKDPTPKQLTRILNQAKQHKIKTIFIQPQFNNKGAKLIASQLGAEVVSLDPYQENYPQMMREIARNIAIK